MASRSYLDPPAFWLRTSVSVAYVGKTVEISNGKRIEGIDNLRETCSVGQLHNHPGLVSTVVGFDSLSSVFVPIPWVNFFFFSAARS